MRQEAARLRVAVVGGGVSGIAAAEWLSAAGAHTTLLESSSTLGGIIRTVHCDGFVIEEGPDGMLTSKPEAVALCERLGLGDDLIDVAMLGALVMHDGRLVRLPPGMSGLVPVRPMSLLRARALSLRGRVRAMCERFISPRTGDDDESIAQFFTRRFGREMFERVTEPLLVGIYAGDSGRLSVAATFPALVRDEQTHGSLLRAWNRRGRQSGGGPAFRSLGRGMSALPDAAAAHLRNSGVTIRMNTAVQAVVHAASGDAPSLRVSLRDGTEEEYDRVVIATPAHVAATLLRNAAPDASRILAAIEHSDIDIVSLGYDARHVTRALDATGYVVPHREGRDVLACSWSSAKWTGRAPAGRVLFRVFVRSAASNPGVARTDDDLRAIARRELSEQVGAHGEPLVTHITRWHRAMPQYHIGHAARMRDLQSLLQYTAGIRLAGNYLEGVGLSDCVRSGHRAAQSLLPPADVARANISRARAIAITETESR